MPWSTGGTICTNEKSRRANTERKKKRQSFQFNLHSILLISDSLVEIWEHFFQVYCNLENAAVSP